jgi:hypothetical protein
MADFLWPNDLSRIFPASARMDSDDEDAYRLKRKRLILAGSSVLTSILLSSWAWSGRATYPRRFVDELLDDECSPNRIYAKLRMPREVWSYRRFIFILRLGWSLSTLRPSLLTLTQQPTESWTSLP